MEQLDRFLLFHRQEQEREKAERDEALRRERLAKEQLQLKARIVLLKDLITQAEYLDSPRTSALREVLRSLEEPRAEGLTPLDLTQTVAPVLSKQTAVLVPDKQSAAPVPSNQTVTPAFDKKSEDVYVEVERTMEQLMAGLRTLMVDPKDSRFVTTLAYSRFVTIRAYFCDWRARTKEYAAELKDLPPSVTETGKALLKFARSAEEQTLCSLFTTDYTFEPERWTRLGDLYERLASAMEIVQWMSVHPGKMIGRPRQQLVDSMGATCSLFRREFRKVQDGYQTRVYRFLRDLCTTEGVYTQGLSPDASEEELEEMSAATEDVRRATIVEWDRRHDKAATAVEVLQPLPKDEETASRWLAVTGQTATIDWLEAGLQNLLPAYNVVRFRGAKNVPPGARVVVVAGGGRVADTLKEAGFAVLAVSKTAGLHGIADFILSAETK